MPDYILKITIWKVGKYFQLRYNLDLLYTVWNSTVVIERDETFPGAYKDGYVQLAEIEVYRLSTFSSNVYIGSDLTIFFYFFRKFSKLTKVKFRKMIRIWAIAIYLSIGLVIAIMVSTTYWFFCRAKRINKINNYNGKLSFMLIKQISLDFHF